MRTAEPVEYDLPKHCAAAAAGSSWAALLVAINVKPHGLAELMRVVGVAAEGKYRARGFDACADAWAIYQDAQEHGANL